MQLLEAYRHLIDSLVRKPGAFANYRYQSAFFPRLCFRQAYDVLKKDRPATADKCYLELLQLAKVQSETCVAQAIELLLEAKLTPTLKAAKELLDVYEQERTKVNVKEPVLADYDGLLSESTMTGRLQ